MSSVPHLDVAFSWNGGVAGHAFFPVVKAVRPEWQTELVKYRYFTEGISNKLIGAHTGATMDDDPDAILIRIHGNDTDLLIDREREKQTFKLLFDHKCSTARLLATFNNGCSYSYIAGRPLDVEDVRQPDICKLIISRMVQMHGIHQSDDASSCVPALFSTLDKWMEIVSSDMRTQRTERMERDVPSAEVLVAELQLLRDSLVPLNSKVVFCHNDLLVKNIIISKAKDSVTFIDNEYANFNYRAFDIADHFCEFAGVDNVDYSRYPDKDFQMQWLQLYLEETARQSGSERSIDTDEIENLYVEVNKFALASKSPVLGRMGTSTSNTLRYRIRLLRVCHY
ncbi:ethanolamine kinase 2-like [Corticium candelabrum]|uniref:ethanolamine kinase 2-like n=1 Tax=Corticium candelabrum TaxID=121492 RepID=UPI002E25E829|nr:ethanolamine kinase 2-like [Corticium candelabrum]